MPYRAGNPGGSVNRAWPETGCQASPFHTASARNVTRVLRSERTGSEAVQPRRVTACAR